MVGGRLKSRRSIRRVFVRTPSGENKIHYRKKKPSRPICSECGKYLHGIPHLIQSKFKNLAKTKKRPERPYGGVLCSRCMRDKIRVNFLEKFNQNELLEKVQSKGKK